MNQMNQLSRQSCQHSFSRYDGKPYIYYYGVHVDRSTLPDPLVTPKKCSCRNQHCPFEHKHIDFERPYRTIVRSNVSYPHTGKIQGYYL